MKSPAPAGPEGRKEGRKAPPSLPDGGRRRSVQPAPSNCRTAAAGTPGGSAPDRGRPWPWGGSPCFPAGARLEGVRAGQGGRGGEAGPPASFPARSLLRALERAAAARAQGLPAPRPGVAEGQAQSGAPEKVRAQAGTGRRWAPRKAGFWAEEPRPPSLGSKAAAPGLSGRPGEAGLAALPQSWRERSLPRLPVPRLLRPAQLFPRAAKAAFPAPKQAETGRQEAASLSLSAARRALGAPASPGAWPRATDSGRKPLLQFLGGGESPNP